MQADEQGLLSKTVIILVLLLVKIMKKVQAQKERACPVEESMKELTGEDQQSIKLFLEKEAKTILEEPEATHVEVEDPHPILIAEIVDLWMHRKHFRSKKILYLNIKLERDQSTRSVILGHLQKVPSIQTTINGQSFPSPGIVREKSHYFYEGTLNNMTIFDMASKNVYSGQVQDFETLLPYGHGVYQSNIGKKNQSFTEGTYVNGQMEGFGTLREKKYLYEGQWHGNKKHGFGKEYYWKKEKKKGQGKFKEESSNQMKSEQCLSETSISNHLQMFNFKEEQHSSRDKKSKNKGLNNLNFSQLKIEEEQSNTASASTPTLNRRRVSYFEGNYQNGMRHGYGREETKLEVYQGHWHEGKKNGQGKMLFKSGAVYQGNWKNNYFEGNGTYTDAGGNVYTGSFMEGMYSGQGTMVYTNGDTYKGEWLNSMKHGEGLYTYENEEYYNGSWVKDSAEGKGTAMIDEIYFDGEYKKGRKHGIGQLTDDNNTTQGFWENNVLIETISIDGEVPE